MSTTRFKSIPDTSHGSKRLKATATTQPLAAQVSVGVEFGTTGLSGTAALTSEDVQTAVTTALGTAIGTGVDAPDSASVAGLVSSGLPVDEASISAAVWAKTSRTLTGAGSGLGPTAGLSTARVGAQVRRHESRPLFAYVYTATDVPAIIASVSAITYSIVLLDNDGCETAIAGHTAVSLAPSAVLYDTIQSDAVAAAWNFKHQPDLALGPAFETLGKYIVRYTFTPASGLPFWVDFDLLCL